jgi:hypothetical protein
MRLVVFDGPIGEKQRGDLAISLVLSDGEGCGLRGSGADVHVALGGRNQETNDVEVAIEDRIMETGLAANAVQQVPIFQSLKRPLELLQLALLGIAASCFAHTVCHATRPIIRLTRKKELACSLQTRRQFPGHLAIFINLVYLVTRRAATRVTPGNQARS